MLSKTLLTPILADDALTRGLGDAEARMLVEWLVEEADRHAVVVDNVAATQREIQRLCRWARGVGRFVQLWCYREAHGAAIQLAASERFDWPLPATWVDPCELMHGILAWQTLGGKMHAAC